MFYSKENTFLLSVLEELPEELDDFIKVYSSFTELDQVKPVEQPTKTTQGSFDVILTDNDDEVIKSYSIHVQKYKV